MTSMNPIVMDDFQPLRRCLAPAYANLPSPQLVALMNNRFGEGAAEAYNDYLEGFFDDLARGVGNVVRQAAPVIANVGSGIVSGAGAGLAGGPIGAIVGGVLGGAGRALGSYAPGPWRQVGNVLNTGVQIAGQFTPQGQLGAQLGGVVGSLPSALRSPQSLLQQVPGLLGAFSPQAGSAAQRLSSLFQNPHVQQAMGALQLGDLGRTSVPVGAGQTPVPVSAITGLLSRLSAQALDEALQEGDAGEADLSYMFDTQGRPLGDPTSETDRQQRLLALLDQAVLERRQAELHAALMAQHQQLTQAPRLTGRLQRSWQPPGQEPGAWAQDLGEDWGEDFGEDFLDAMDEASDVLGAEAWDGSPTEAVDEGWDEAADEAFDEGADEALDEAFDSPWDDRSGLSRRTLELSHAFA